MEYTLEQKKGQELLGKLITKSWENPSFKEYLISNPKAAIEEIAGPNDNQNQELKIVVEDQTDTNFIYLNIPRKIDTSSIELTDEQLDHVAGGDLVIVAGIALFCAGVYLGYNSK